MRTLIEEAAGNLHIEKKAALEFLIVFSRFEYALKERHFVHKAPPVPRDLQVNYSDYAQSIRDPFAQAYEANAKLKEAADYLCFHPPRRQIWDGTKPDWAPPEANAKPSSHQMLVFIFRVRNNLFHGGKGWLPPEGNAERDKTLMAHSLTIIDAILEIDSDLKQAFSSFQ
ncbi:MAG: hypothetical protein ABS35_24825 [Kaistia sp. SCN 65-12]|nr:MAG: hypothetical protein ABS35_24825 [Kaistia sp. SCN 65-12]